jgi:RNA polymerase sigma-70 factor, ECF subfamily
VISSKPANTTEEKLDETPDQELVSRCQQGDMASFTTLVTRYRGRVYSLIYQMVRHEAESWDLSQETFVKAWRALPKFEGNSAFFTWLYRIAHNTAYDFLRSKKNQPLLEFDDITAGSIAVGAVTTPHQDESPDERLMHSELGKKIQSALAQLSPDHRAVVVLKEIDGLSYQEIAKALNCTEGTVMSRLFYARKKLQALLADVERG